MLTAAILALTFAIALVLLPVLIRLEGGLEEETEVSVCAGGALLAGLVGVLYRKHGDQASLGLVVGRWRVMTLKTFEGASGVSEEPDSTESEGSEEIPVETPELVEVTGEVASARRGRDEAVGSESGIPEPEEPKVDTPKESVESLADETLWNRVQHLIDLADRLRRPAYRFIRRLIASIRIRRLRADIRYGSGSPDETGRAIGYAAAIRPLLGSRAMLNLQPDFTRQRLNGTADLVIALWPARLVWAIACMSPHALTLWFTEKKRSKQRRKAA